MKSEIVGKAQQHQSWYENFYFQTNFEKEMKLIQVPQKIVFFFFPVLKKR